MSEPRVLQNPRTGMLYTNRPLSEEELRRLNRILFGNDSPQPAIPLGSRLDQEEVSVDQPANDGRPRTSPSSGGDR